MWDEFNMEEEEDEDLAEETMSASIASYPKPFAVVRKRRPSRLAGVLNTLRAAKKQLLGNPYRQKAIKPPKI